MATERRGSQAGRTERWCDTSGAEGCCLEEDSSEGSCSQASRIAKNCRDTNDVHGAKDSIEQVRDPINCEVSCWARRSMVWLTGNQPPVTGIAWSGEAPRAVDALPSAWCAPPRRWAWRWTWLVRTIDGFDSAPGSHFADQN